MAKGDILQRMQMGIQPGLVPPGSVGGPSNGMGIGSKLLPYGEVNDPNPTMIPDNGMPTTGQAGPRLMPMQSGTMFAQGKHPIGTGPKKMLKYNNG